MYRAMVFSAVLHLSVAVFAVLGLPVLFDREPIVDRPVVVEVVTIDEKTTPPPSPPKREPPRPAPPRRAEPEAVEVPPPPKAVEIPPPPLPETVLAKPEPKPEPKVAKIPPQPKPEPKITKVMPKPKPERELPKKRLVNVKPRPKPLTPREDFTASVLKDLSERERRPTEPEQTEEAEKKVVLRPPPLLPSVDQRMTVSELDAIRRQIEACWNIPAGARDAENLVVDIRVVMNPDGTVRHASVVDRDRMARDTFFRAAAESALRAVLNPRCNPLKLPLKKYEQWQSFTLSFNPRELIGS